MPEEQPKAESKLIQLGALWEREGKKGRYLSGPFGNAQLLVFPNAHKRSERDPDWLIYLAPSKGRKPREAPS